VFYVASGLVDRTGGMVKPGGFTCGGELFENLWVLESASRRTSAEQWDAPPSEPSRTDRNKRL